MLARPCKSVLTFKVSHESRSSRVERVDDHLPVHRPCDLHPAVLESLHRPRSLPALVLPDVLRLGQEIGQRSSVKLSLKQDSAVEEVLPGRVERAVEGCEELERGGREDVGVRTLDFGWRRGGETKWKRIKSVISSVESYRARTCPPPLSCCALPVLDADGRCGEGEGRR